MQGTILQDLISLQQAQIEAQHVFPSLESIRWYLRQNRQRLQRAGAILTIAGRIWVNRKVFEHQVLCLGNPIIPIESGHTEVHGSRVEGQA